MKRLNTKLFILRAIKVHGAKYNYEQTQYLNAKTKVDIICPIHGNFSQNPNIHINKKCGCPKCAKEVFIKNNQIRKKNTSWFIENAHKIHNNKYDYTLVNYNKSTDKVKIICPEHGIFNQTPTDHINGQYGCVTCGRNTMWERNILSRQDSFIQRSTSIHGNIYNYASVIYKNNSTVVNIICPIHGSFSQRPDYHLHGSGCPQCSGSRGEKIIINLLKQNNIEYIFQHTFNDCRNPETNKILPFDFYIPNRRLIVEFHGEQHYNFIPHFHKTEYNFKKMQARDNIKAEYLLTNGYKLSIINQLNESAIFNTLFK